MSDLTKNEAIIEALESAGYQDITLKVIPKRFLFSDGRYQTELEFSRNYFDDITLVTLQNLMHDKILPAIKQQLGKKVYVSAHGISIIPTTHGREDDC
ncbi:MAG: hypothetical protein LZF60_220176 [Nitrospira sp.]|nr:MAG: hypothetical protein LZF60_220176 [Nitrospira sp.]